ATAYPPRRRNNPVPSCRPEIALGARDHDTAALVVDVFAHLPLFAGPDSQALATSFMLIERKSGMSSRIVALLPRKSRSANRVKPTLPICRSCWDAADGLRLTAVATSNDQNSTYRMSSSDECGRRASTHLSAMLLPRSAWMAAAVPVE